MFVEPGDTVRGRDGDLWLVLAVHRTGELSLWRQGRPTWTGNPKGTVNVVRLANQDAIEAVLHAIPGTSVVKAVGATMANLIGYPMIRASADPSIKKLFNGRAPLA
jgi:hypothetical protein